MSDVPTPSLRQEGFSLVEMAVVLVLVGLMLGGLLTPLSAQIDQRNFNEVRGQIEEIKEAVMGYALATGQLPCPAKPTIASDSSGAGIADCAVVGNGVVPWATLGIKEVDPWGRRFTYRVTTYFADPIASFTYGTGCSPSVSPSYASFALCSIGNIDILTASGGNIMASSVPAIVVSHGKNGAGAFLRDGTQVTVSSDADEKENADADAIFVDHAMTPSYDDVVSWIPGVILFNRMVAASKLP